MRKGTGGVYIRQFEWSVGHPTYADRDYPPALAPGEKENERHRYPASGLALASLSDAKGPTGADQTRGY
jgi:hypothetical protein